MNGSDFDDISSSTKTASFGVSDIEDAQRRAKAVQTVMDCFNGWLDSSRCHTDTVEGECHSKTNIKSPCHASWVDAPDGSCNKRKHDSERDSLSQSDQQKAPKTKHVKSSANLKFACPFFKKDPSRFTRRQACSGPGFSSISRVKEMLEEHQRAEVPCKICTNNFSDGINEAQYIRLRRKPSGQKTDIERWEEIYRIVFPKASTIPSCYYELKDTTTSSSKDYSLGLKQMENALVAGVQRDLEDRFEQVETDLKASFLLMVKERVELTIQEFLDKNGSSPPTELPALTTQAESPVDLDLEPPALEFDTELAFDFQNFGPGIEDSQFTMDQSLMTLYHGSPGRGLGLQI
ncbi:hypothetical protein PFICI_02716 [Pestalotiopsis fici W106-1]|uniref:Uncharacterized protein n=1 Tax=Pestalotiopsis fici (strain W106-1 / CGMCC3.15140) TaxID=1229662 RepID=W3XHJ1_PESFW|nr:uncharacterized protein PFICI_02716 [Pestalotiopsis fici W106-1]ETS84691.1 hypothetical protein PFICI_02716 [Pestalotiopsis fici W106-1]